MLRPPRVTGLPLALVVLAGCPNPSSSKPSAENKNPYRDVTPQKVKEKVEAAQKQEDDRADKKLEEAK